MDEKIRMEDDVEKITQKGKKLGIMCHKILKNKTIRLIAIIFTIFFGILGFIFVFGKALLKGKND